MLVYTIAGPLSTAKKRKINLTFSVDNSVVACYVVMDPNIKKEKGYQLNIAWGYMKVKGKKEKINIVFSVDSSMIMGYVVMDA